MSHLLKFVAILFALVSIAALVCTADEPTKLDESKKEAVTEQAVEDDGKELAKETGRRSNRVSFPSNRGAAFSLKAKLTDAGKLAKPYLESTRRNARYAGKQY